MLLLELLLFLFSVHSLASPFQRTNVRKMVRAADAPYSVDTSTLAASLTCPYGNPTAASPAVLLVHGTSSTGEDSWAEGYAPALKANGYSPCWVTLPGRAMGDMQVSAEYVAYNIIALSELSGGAKISIITHSQGGPNVQWALQFWPSTRDATRAFVALSPDFTGINLLGSRLSKVCVGKLCQASLWQQSAGSQYYKALHFENFEALVPTTTIWTKYDGIVNPPKANAQLPGATVVSVQSLCPLRGTTHPAMTVDSAAFALALDALKNNGKASVLRVLPRAIGICLRVTADKMKVTVEQTIEDGLEALIDGFLLGSPRVDAEPAIKAYASAFASK